MKVRKKEAPVTIADRMRRIQALANALAELNGEDLNELTNTAIVRITLRPLSDERLENEPFIAWVEMSTVPTDNGAGRSPEIALAELEHRLIKVALERQAIVDRASATVAAGVLIFGITK